MNEKSYTISGFRDSFMTIRCSETTLIGLATSYIRSLQDGTGLAYSGRLDYTPERYTENGDPIPPDTAVKTDSQNVGGPGVRLGDSGGPGIDRNEDLLK